MDDVNTAQGADETEWVLALDTALGGCCVCLVNLRSRLSYCEAQEGMRGQTEHLLPLIDRVLAQAGVAYQQLGLIAAITGPGSFTGIRVGLAVANALQLGLGVPAVGIDAFTAYRALLPKGIGKHQIIIDTYRDDFFVATYDDYADCNPELRIAVREDILLSGDLPRSGNGLARLHAAGDAFVPEMLDLAAVVLALHDDASLSKSAALNALSPYYMREADTSESRQKAWHITA